MFHYVSVIKKNKYNIQPVNCSVNTKLFEKRRTSANETATGVDTSLISSERAAARATQSQLDHDLSPAKLSRKSKRYFAMSMNSFTD